MFKLFSLAVLGATYVLADNAANETKPDVFADPYDQQAAVEKLVKEHIALEKEKAELVVKQTAAGKEVEALKKKKGEIADEIKELTKAAEKVKTDAKEYVKAQKKVTEATAKLTGLTTDLTKAQTAKTAADAKVLTINGKITAAFMKISQAQDSVGNKPTTDEVLRLLTNGKGSLFKMAEVVEESNYAAWALWEQNLKDCQTRWTFLKGTDQAEADKNVTETSDIYKNRVSADELAIKACKDFAAFVKTNVTDPWQKNATDSSKTTAEVVLKEFPKLEWEAAEKQYIHDYIKAEYSQAKTMLALNKDNATNKQKLEQVIEEMKQYHDIAKDQLKDANKDLKEAKAGGMAWPWIVAGLVFGAGSFYALWKCYCKKGNTEEDKEL